MTLVARFAFGDGAWFTSISWVLSASILAASTYLAGRIDPRRLLQCGLILALVVTGLLAAG
jgi:hypothetical protein